MNDFTVYSTGMTDHDLLMIYGPCLLCGASQDWFTEMDDDGHLLSGIRCTRYQIHDDLLRRPSWPVRLWRKFGFGGLLYLATAIGIASSLLCMYVLWVAQP